MTRFLFIGFIGLVLGLLQGAVQAEPIVIAHRGASGYLPEHTLAAYEKAILLGADYIEPDLVLTKDSILVARHEHYLSQTTDVAARPEFAGRKRLLNGRHDWFSEDFTLAEIKTLRTRQAFKGRDSSFDGQFTIPTFAEVIELVRSTSDKVDRKVGIYPETKVPSHFQSLGYDVAGQLLAVLEQHNLNRRDAAVYIQSFEPEILKELNGRVKVPLVQLVRAVRKLGGIESNISLAEISSYADVVGPSKWLLINHKGEDTGYVSAAHGLNLPVHIWTIRDDAFPEKLFDSPEEELNYFLELGIDGFFTDFPDTGVAARNEFLTKTSPALENP